MSNPREEQGVLKPVRSSVNLAVLYLLHEKPSYAYEVATRFIARYGDFFRSRHQNIYTAFDRLKEQRLIEAIPDEGLEVRPRSSERQPKVVYRITARGLQLLTTWLSSPLPKRDTRREVAIRMRSMEPDDYTGTLRLLERLEETLPSDSREAGSRDPRPTRGIVDELLRENEAIGVEEQRRWIAVAREKVSRQAAVNAG